MGIFQKMFKSLNKEQSEPPKKFRGQKPEDIIMSKLRKGNKQAQNMAEDELREWARSLCVKEELIEWYLNPEFATTIKIFDKLEETNAKQVTKKSGGGFMKSTSESVESAPTIPKEDDDDAFNDIDFDIQEIETENQKPHMKVGKKIKIKLVIAEICKSDAQKAIRKLLSPILTTIDYQQHFGMFHSALVIGPWYLEWNNSSLCIPRKCYSSAAMLAADLEFGGKLGSVGFDLDDTVQKISDVVIKWNTGKNYDQRQANCQQFVDDCCAALGIDMKFEGPLGDYLAHLREKGECEISFPITDDMRETLRLDYKKKSFATHLELDEFVNELLQKDPEFNNNYPLEWGLLKSFDRAFWLRHFKHADDAKFTPHSDCPFKDPTMTASFKKEWF